MRGHPDRKFLGCFTDPSLYRLHYPLTWSEQVSEINDPIQIQKDLSNAIWAHTGRSTVGFVRVADDSPTSLGSGTLVRFGEVAGILTCAHVLEALAKEDNIGLLCFPVRAAQIQRLQLSMATTDSAVIGCAPWGETGPDLAFLRLPIATVVDIERVASITNGDIHRRNIMAGEPSPSRELCALAGVVDEMTGPAIIDKIPNGTIATTSFEAVINVGHVIVDADASDKFRFQPVVSAGIIPPASYKGTSGGGLWKFYLNQYDFSLLQARLIGVAYWEKPMGKELHLIGHGQISIYETLFNIIRQKWL